MTVTIPASGNALVTLTLGSSTSATDLDCLMAFAVSGATTRVSSDAQSFRNPGRSVANAVHQGSATYLVTGLTAGSNTFTAQYRLGTAGTCTFLNRNIIVIPLP